MSEQRQKNVSIYPDALGEELENGIQLLNSGTITDPSSFMNNFERLIPDRIRGTDTFMLNGSKIYIDGPAGLETCTPECSDPDQLLVYDRVNEHVIEFMIRNYFKSLPRSQRPQFEVRTQRRVIDSRFNRKGAHDNFGYESGYLRHIDEYMYPTSIPRYLAARNFMVGAGLVTADSLQFSQKVGGLIRVFGYGYQGYMFRTTNEEGGNRVEFRCGDTNISPWATRMRIGSAALHLALNQESYTRGKLHHIGSGIGNYIEYANDSNIFSIDPDGELTPTIGTARSVAYQRNCAELALTELPRYEPMPGVYQEIASEIIKFCDDFERVVKGDQHFSSLAGRADWAAKFNFIQEYFERHGYSAEGESGDPYTGKRARALDLLYDIRHYGSDKEGEPYYKKYGYGFSLRDSGHFATPVSAADIQRGWYTPPQATRAKLRTDLMRQHQVKGVDWNFVKFSIGNKVVRETFNSAHKTELSQEHKEYYQKLIDAAAEDE